MGVLINILFKKDDQKIEIKYSSRNSSALYLLDVHTNRYMYGFSENTK